MNPVSLLSLLDYVDSNDLLSIRQAQQEAQGYGFRSSLEPDTASYLIRCMTAALTGDKTYTEAMAMAIKVCLNGRSPMESLAFRMFVTRTEAPKLKLTCGLDSARVIFDMEAGFFRVNGSVDGRGGVIVEIIYNLNSALTSHCDRSGVQHPIELHAS